MFKNLTFALLAVSTIGVIVMAQGLDPMGPARRRQDKRYLDLLDRQSAARLSGC